MLIGALFFQNHSKKRQRQKKSDEGIKDHPAKRANLQPPQVYLCCELNPVVYFLILIFFSIVFSFINPNDFPIPSCTISEVRFFSASGLFSLGGVGWLLLVSFFSVFVGAASFASSLWVIFLFIFLFSFVFFDNPGFFLVFFLVSFFLSCLLGCWVGCFVFVRTFSYSFPQDPLSSWNILEEYLKEGVKEKYHEQISKFFKKLKGAYCEVLRDFCSATYSDLESTLDSENIVGLVRTRLLQLKSTPSPGLLVLPFSSSLLFLLPSCLILLLFVVVGSVIQCYLFFFDIRLF